MGTFLGFRVISWERGQGDRGGGEGDGEGVGGWWNGDVIEFPHARVAVVVCAALFLSIFTAVRPSTPSFLFLLLAAYID